MTKDNDKGRKLEKKKNSKSWDIVLLVVGKVFVFISYYVQVRKVNWLSVCLVDDYSTGKHLCILQSPI